MQGMVLGFCWDVAHKMGVAVHHMFLNGKKLSPHLLSFAVEPIAGRGEILHWGDQCCCPLDPELPIHLHPQCL